MSNRDQQTEFMAAKYDFPYHYLPSASDGYWQSHRQLVWGFEYLAYLGEVIRLVENNLDGGAALDVGCGDGRLVNELAARGNGPITGVDIDERAIMFATAFSQSPDVTFTSGNLNSLPERAFKVATAIEVIEHIPDENIAEFVSDIRDRVSDDGTLIVSVPTTNVPVTREHHRHYDLELLSSHLSPHFEINDHLYIHQNSILFKLIKYMSSNRLFTTNSKFGLRMLTRLYRRYVAIAKASTGTHLVAVFKAKN
jgi:2-polyprenyl-3-methyl-5-hydroxy-6-metoxy-1,4-benzoquinol methylase